MAFRGALDCAPARCKCGLRLRRPMHGPCPEVKGYWCTILSPLRKLEGGGMCWWTDCAKCHTTYVWEWHPESNGCWRIRSRDPLFDTREVIVVA